MTGPDHSRDGPANKDRFGLRRVRVGAEWGRGKYGGSSAQYVWNRLNALDFINLGILFAATLLFVLHPVSHRR